MIAEYADGSEAFVGLGVDILENGGDAVSRLAMVSSTTLEMLGILWSLVWVLAAIPQGAGIDVSIHSDSMVAIGVSELVFVSRAHPELQALTH